MSDYNIKEISKVMRHIDICMMTTKTARLGLESRPMSNNRQVDYNGESFFFTDDRCSAAKEIESDPQVNLSYVHNSTLGKNMYISISGKASLIHDKEVMRKHWVKELDMWFKQGLDTPGIVLINVKAEIIKYWAGMDAGEIVL